MKTITIFLAFLMLCTSPTFAQSKKELKEQNEKLEMQNQLLMEMLLKQQNNSQGNTNTGSSYNAGVNNQQVADNDGFIESNLSPIEEMCYEIGIDEIRAYGSAQSAKENLARNMAESNAVAEIRRKIETYVRYGMDQYNDITESQGQVGFDSKTREQTITAAKGLVQGANIIKTRKLYNPKSRMYKYEVCVKYDKAAILGEMEKQNQRILKNEKQFEKDMMTFWDELDRAHGDVSLAEEKSQRDNEMNQSNLDRQAQRDSQARQQEADNDFRENESQGQYNQQQQNNTVIQ